MKTTSPLDENTSPNVTLTTNSLNTPNTLTTHLTAVTKPQEQLTTTAAIDNNLIKSLLYKPSDILTTSSIVGNDENPGI